MYFFNIMNNISFIPRRTFLKYVGCIFETLCRCIIIVDDYTSARYSYIYKRCKQNQNSVWQQKTFRFVCTLLNSTRYWQVVSMQNLVLLIALVFIPGVAPYPYGPPPGSCMSMFPKGHGVDAQMSTPPFDILVNSTSYREGDVIQSK